MYSTMVFTHPFICLSSVHPLIHPPTTTQSTLYTWEDLVSSPHLSASLGFQGFRPIRLPLYIDLLSLLNLQVLEKSTDSPQLIMVQLMISQLYNGVKVILQ